MKIISFLIIAFTAFSGFAQDNLTNFNKVPLGQYYFNEQTNIKFVKVLVDSRCPKNVNCVRAGEAKVLVAIYDNDTFVSNKELVIDASGIILKPNNVALTNELFSIYAVGLYPYPVSGLSIEQKDYVLELGTEYITD